MGNAQSDAFHKGQSLKSLNLSQKLPPEEYIKHTNGDFLEGSFDKVPADIVYYDTITMYEDINFSFNSITLIPEEMSLRVPHLQNFNLSHNRLVGLPDSFKYFLHLRVLDLSFNCLETFPVVITHLHKIHTLNIGHNAVVDIPSTISNLKKLKRLNVSHNQLRALPESLLECSNLSVIVTIGNHLIHPPQVVCDKGCAATLQYLSDTRIPMSEKPTVSPAVTEPFTRVRGQQVMASVSNPESASREYKQAQGTARTNKRKCPLMAPSHATTLAPDELKDAILGLVYGACVGDALGLNVEGLNGSERLFFYPDRSAIFLKNRISDLLRSYYPPNDWSANADIMLITLDSLMRWGGVVDELDLASQVTQWRVHGTESLDPFPGRPTSPLVSKVLDVKGYPGDPHGSAFSLFRRESADRDRGVPSSEGINLGDNACLPSAIVLGIPHFFKPSEVAMNAERISRATHASPAAVAASVFVAQVAAFILCGKLRPARATRKDGDENGYESVYDELISMLKSAISSVGDDISTDALLSSVTVSKPKVEDVLSDDVSVTLRHVVSALTKAVESSASFESCLFPLITSDDDGKGAAVHCCVVGGLVGACVGYSALPKNLIAELPKENLTFISAKLNNLLDLFGLP